MKNLLLATLSVLPQCPSLTALHQVPLGLLGESNPLAPELCSSDGLQTLNVLLILKDFHLSTFPSARQDRGLPMTSASDSGVTQWCGYVIYV